MDRSFVLCELAGTSYAVNSTAVEQIEMIEHITPVPNAPPAVDGVVMVRGKVIPALNLRARFGFERVPHTMRSRLVIVTVGDRSVGLIVDSAREFVAIAEDAIQPPPETISGLSGRYLAGIARLGERIVLVLDLEEVVNHADLIAARQEGNEPRRSGL